MNPDYSPSEGKGAYLVSSYTSKLPHISAALSHKRNNKIFHKILLSGSCKWLGIGLIQQLCIKLNLLFLQCLWTETLNVIILTKIYASPQCCLISDMMLFGRLLWIAG